MTFNAPGIASAGSTLITDAGKFIAQFSERVTHYIVNGDIASMAGSSFIPGNFVTAEFSDPIWFDFEKHTRPIIAESYTSWSNLGNIVISRAPDVMLGAIEPVETLNDPAFEMDDPDMWRWLAGAVAVLGIIDPSKAMFPLTLARRDTTEAARQGIGHAIKTVIEASKTGEAAFDWTIDAARATLNIAAERGVALWELVRPGFNSDFNFTIDIDEPPGLVFQQSLSLTVGDGISINLPEWLGGKYTADHLLETLSAQLGGRLDTEKLLVNGQVNVLGDLITVSGSSELNWALAKLRLTGGSDILNGFITTNAQLIFDGKKMTSGGSAALSVPNSAPNWLFPGTTLSSGSFLLNYAHDLPLSNSFVAAWGSLGPLMLGTHIRLNGDVDLLGAKEINSLSTNGVLGGVPTSSQQYSIEPDTNWVLFNVNWENELTGVELSLITPSGQTLNEADFVGHTDIGIVNELSTSRRRAVLVNNPEAGTWTVGLNGGDAGKVEFLGLRDGDVATVNITQMSHVETNKIRVNYDAQSADPNAQVSLYYSTDDNAFGGILLKDGLSAQGAASYDWDISEVTSGEYYIHAIILSESSIPGTSTVPITIGGASIAGGYVRHGNYSGQGTDIDSGKFLAKEGTAPVTLGYENLINSSRGINGLVFDIDNLPNTSLTASDFQFQWSPQGAFVETDHPAGNWQLAPDPSSITVLPDELDRVIIDWPDNAIANRWLRITVKANANTGLATPEVYYIGHLLGETTGPTGSTFTVSFADITPIRSAVGSSVNASSTVDIDKNGTVAFSDISAM